MWERIFSEFVTTDRAFVVHVYLLAGDVLATIAVGFGIIWESVDAPPNVHPIARRLVIWGVITETLCSLALFTFDEGISNTQQSKILFLENQMAERTLDKSQTEALESVKGKVKAVNIMPEAALEPNAFADWIANALQDAGVKVRLLPSSSGIMMTGIMILYPESLKDVGNLAQEPLYAAFTKAGLLPGAGSLQNWFPFMNIPRDVPLVFVGEKYMFVTKPPYPLPVRH